MPTANPCAAPSERTIAIAPEALRRVPMRMLVVAGAEKRTATAALLRGGFVTHLVIDEASARAMLDL